MIFLSFPKPTRKVKVRKSIRKIGKIGKRNIDANKKLHKIYEDKEIGNICEPRESKNCWHCFQGYLHRHGRHWYRSHPELLYSYTQTLRGCNECHRIIDANPVRREEIFMRLRGPELL